MERKNHLKNLIGYGTLGGLAGLVSAIYSVNPEASETAKWTLYALIAGYGSAACMISYGLAEGISYLINRGDRERCGK